MKIPYFCCIGAELKRYSQDFDFMNQVYLYKVPTDDSIDEVLSEDYFKDVSSSVLQDDIIFIYEASARKLHECRFDKQNGHITAVPLEFGEFVKKTGDTMSGDLVFQYSMSYPALHIMQSEQNTSILRFFKFGSSAGQAISFDLSQAAIHPLVTGIGHLGTNAIHFGDAHIDKVYTGFINNGYDIAVPVTNSADTLALKSEVDLAANSGRMITGQGVWYAKMYAATVAPSAENGTNYADFSQVDGQGNPIIVTYNRVNGAWVQDQIITPPAEYDGYVPITSKIWDIAEQAGQQGGRILWNHQSKEFTPYPQIISFEDIEITGTSTVVMPQNPGTNQIVNKDYVDEAIAAIPTPTVDIKQSIDAEIVGTLTVADNGDVSGFSSSNYLEYPGDIDMTNASTFEIVMVVTRWADSGGYFISERPDSILTDKHLTFMITGLTNPVLRFDVNDGSNYQSLTGTTILANNIKYYAKIAYDGTNYTLSLSTDGINYTTEATAVAQYLPGKTTYPYVIGRASTAWHYVHMAECYIKENGILVWQGMDSPGLHQRVAKGHEVIEFQAPTAGNNYKWYRKYADGWVEQGGRISNVAHNSHGLYTLPVTMADTNYVANAWCTQIDSSATFGSSSTISSAPGSTTQVRIGQANASSVTMDIVWEVKGMYAQ